MGAKSTVFPVDIDRCAWIVFQTPKYIYINQLKLDIYSISFDLWVFIESDNLHLFMYLPYGYTSACRMVAEKNFKHHLWQPIRMQKIQIESNRIEWVIVGYDCGFDTPTLSCYSGNAIHIRISTIANQSPLHYNRKNTLFIEHHFRASDFELSFSFTVPFLCEPNDTLSFSHFIWQRLRNVKQTKGNVWLWCHIKFHTYPEWQRKRITI